MYFNVLDELDPFLSQFEKLKIVDNKLIACSPFREDHRPSFVLWLDKGNWKDSGGVNKTAGSFIELLAFLTGEDRESVFNYLREKYTDLPNVDELQLSLNLSLQGQTIKVFDSLPEQYRFRHPYLTERGISESVQRGFKIGYDKESNAVVIPWTNKEGQIVRLLFRSVKTKKFWYSKEGDRIKNHLFGLFHIYRKNSTKAYIVEAPIDCMYLWTLGIPSIATGSASISENQLKLLKQSPIEQLVIATDNDEAGNLFSDVLISKLSGFMDLKRFKFPPDAKDVNDLKPSQITENQEQEICHQFVIKKF